MREHSLFATMPPAKRSWITISISSLLFIGCQGSVQTEANASASSNGQEEVNFDSESDTAWDGLEPDPSNPGEPDFDQPSTPEDSSTSKDSNASTAGKTETALLGARHDLQMAKGQSPDCHCLAVVVGTPNSEGLSWRQAPPEIDRTTQLVVGLSSKGVSCPVTAKAASYMGYQVRGTDVVVLVEAAAVGRPLTQGAIIPRPKPGGSVIIEGSGEVPYGKPLERDPAEGEHCVVHPREEDRDASR